MQMRTMHFLGHLNSAFHQRRSVLLAQKEVPSLDEAVAAMIQEESRMQIHTEQSAVVNARSAQGVNAGDDTRSAWRVSGTGIGGTQGETRKCFNCGEVGHLVKDCRKPLKGKDTIGRGTSGVRGRSRGGRRGGRGANWANMMVAEEGEERRTGLSKEDMTVKAASQIVMRRQREAEKEKGGAEDDDWVAYTVAHAQDTLALATAPFTRSSDWIINSGASRHVTGTAGDLPREGDGQGTWDWHTT